MQMIEINPRVEAAFADVVGTFATPSFGGAS